jgi:hypothetical protein
MTNGLNSAQSCVPCALNPTDIYCHGCQYNYTRCSYCTSGYGPNSNYQCVQCFVSNCNVCSLSYYHCILCNSSYTLYSKYIFYF